MNNAKILIFKKANINGVYKAMKGYREKKYKLSQVLHYFDFVKKISLDETLINFTKQWVKSQKKKKQSK